jgi:hypothetical protein
MTLWKVSCLEDTYPGMWQRWYRHQSVGIGWPPMDGYYLNGSTAGGQGWSRARESLKAVAVGDHIVVTLRGHRLGRLGEVTGKAIEDAEWNPLVPASRESTSGQMGRRILVRWDLTVGPDSRDMVIALPREIQLASGELRPTIGQVRSRSTAELVGAMNDPSNWVGLLTHFDYERALSGYIAAYPHRLEDGLLPHPNKRVREKVFLDGSRSDVLLTDRQEVPVVVECKQGGPTVEHLKQIRNYMVRLAEETGGVVRGILVHGGARKLPSDVALEAQKSPAIEIVQYSLDVDFTPCN